ncbi:MAG: HAD-IIIA family hydrolase [Deltaproteobacteria bacterium]|jgi:D-glycero-D-manno-heptose 1,7-bisphosphate phosphatase|nr:HAD-IIIA family hydrolase [Deltaproteobacteria bacterium]
MMAKRAVFFDRDGVLNLAEVKDGRPYPPKDAASVVITPGAPALLTELRELDFLLIAVTNQPDVARKTKTEAEVTAINDRIRFELALNDLFVCLHDNPDNCQCRKPKPGMLLAAAAKWKLDLPSCWMVGDRAGDIGAGRSAGCRTIFIDYDYAEPKPAPPADYTCPSLNQAVAIINEVTVHHESFSRFKGQIIR